MNIFQKVGLQENIPAVSPKDSGQLVNDGLGGRASPAVGYIPGAAPEVVKVATAAGSNVYKETEKPQPDILKNDFSTITTFTTVTFKDATGDGSQFQAGRREEFFLVNCFCEFDVASTGKGRMPTVWDGTGYVTGKEVHGKLTASIDTTRKGQPTLCTACCRDHHDTQNLDLIQKYDPFRPAAYYSSATGDHLHYALNDTTGVLTAVNPLASTAARC